MNALELKNLTKHYKDFSLEGLSLTLPAGYILGLAGENGAGKTTTFRLILDMIDRDGGSVTILGRDNKTAGPLVREDVGVVMDDVGLPASLTATQIGTVMSRIFSRWDMAAFEGYLARLSVPAEKPFKGFSRGMKMKLGIAVAMSHGAKLLLLDEATSGLDPVVRDEVLDMFSEFTRSGENAVLLSSHIVSDLEKICDYIAFLHKGKLLLMEETDRLRENYAMVLCPVGTLASVDPAAVVGVRRTPYGEEAILRREAVPAGIEPHPVELEQLFIFMVKGDN